MTKADELSPLAVRLRQARELKGLTVKQVADRVGLTEGAIRHWENDARDPSLEHIGIVARMYGVSTDWILLGRGRGPKNLDPETDELLDTWDEVESTDRPRALQAIKIFAASGRR